MTVPSCIFCRIVAGEIPARMVFEDDRCIAFHDLSAQAPTHVLVVPREHVGSVAALSDVALGAALLQACAEVARRTGIEGSGYRVVTNVGSDGGQSVAHLHFHVLGGRPMRWPPG